MSSPGTTEAADTAEVRHPDVRIAVRNFGPVAAGEFDLRPLTVFVGPSNTGKTYLAILIYALHRVFGGFPKLPLSPHQFQYGIFHNPFNFGPRIPKSGGSISNRTLNLVADKLNNDSRPFKFSDLPKIVRDTFESNFKDPDSFAADLITELKRCFDIESVSDVIRQPQGNDARISLKVSDEERDLWQFALNSSEDITTSDGRIRDMVLLPGGRVARNVRGIGRIQGLAQNGKLKKYIFLQKLLNILADREEGRETFYLPAVRGGIMQSHRVIASALVARSTRAGFEDIPQVPTFSGGVADFMQRLILFDDDETGSERMAELAGALERETLAGRILTTRPSAGGYPEFVYRAKETEQEIRLTRASSMVSELAPVVLFLRGVVSPGDTFIIEEPEAHLHPAAQTRMAMTLARLVRAGVRVVVTTHSDWLLREIANLMREGEMGKPPGEPSARDVLPAWLSPHEVGIWLFSRQMEAGGSRIEEVPFDRVEGVEPRDYEEVAEALYNRSAELQNQLAEAERNKREQDTR